MQTIEFETDAQGRMIEIPEKFAAFASKHLKVHISLAEDNSGNAKPVQRLSALSIDTRPLKFDREDANAR